MEGASEEIDLMRRRLVLGNMFDDVFGLEPVGGSTLNRLDDTKQDVTLRETDFTSINATEEFLILDRRNDDVLSVEEPPLVSFLEG